MTLPAASTEHVYRPRPAPHAELRLYCFPYAGAGPSIYRTWPDHLPGEIEVCAVELPGRGRRMAEPPMTDVEALAARLVDELGDELSDRARGPFAFFGHSMGAGLAFELARALRRRGLRGPVRLLASGRNAPQKPWGRAHIHALPTPEFLARLRDYNGTPSEILQHAELLELLLPILRADFRAVETYQYRDEPPLDCPISAFGGEGDERTDRAGLEAWGVQSRAGCTARLFPGDHFYLRGAQRSLLAAVAQDLLNKG
jgi:medium-chain acyl-[acyl-carrier-protein] hydrolase